MNNCEQFERLISDSLDGQLEEEKRLELESHLPQCPACREFLSAVKADSDRLQKLPVLNCEKSSPYIVGYKVRRRAWMRTVSVPLPLAASILVILLGWGTLGWFRPAPPSHRAVSGDRRIENVRIERLKPAQPAALTGAGIETHGR